MLNATYWFSTENSLKLIVIYLYNLMLYSVAEKTVLF